ncbi:MAG: nucleotide exchange factor GrpE [Chlorobiaceae bacterium]|jgi:molecular chaperone GrpE|nr:nucleotide exchange factor GrpE [Chlorobiaceae bacterium]
MIKKGFERKEHHQEKTGEKQQIPVTIKGSEETLQNAEIAVENQSAKEVEALSARIAELESELTRLKEQADKFRDELLRKAAEFENFRRQKERETMQASSRALENVIRELLPVVDDVQRVLDNAPTDPESAGQSKPFIDGVDLVRKNLDKWLGDKGVKAIESKGQKLDVNFHEAISQIDHPEAETDTIVHEYQTGYLLGDKVIRHAKVIVAR